MWFLRLDSFTFSKLSHVVIGISTSLPSWLNNIPSYGYTTFWHLGRLHLSSTMSIAIIDISVQFSWVYMWECNDCLFLHSILSVYSLPGFLHAVHSFNKHIPGNGSTTMNKHAKVPAFICHSKKQNKNNPQISKYDNFRWGLRTILKCEVG